MDDAKMGGWIQGWILTLWKHQITQLPLRQFLCKGIHASARSDFTESIMFGQWVSRAKRSRLIYLREANRGRFFHSVSTKHLIQNRKGKCDFSQPSKQARGKNSDFLNFRQNYFLFLFSLGFYERKDVMDPSFLCVARSKWTTGVCFAEGKERQSWKLK